MRYVFASIECESYLQIIRLIGTIYIETLYSSNGYFRRQIMNYYALEKVVNPSTKIVDIT